MDVVSLKVFLAVTETGSFSAAAERVHITQPAISKRIASLEQALNTRLFDRIGRRIALTPAGVALAQRARHLIAEIEDIKRGVSKFSRDIAGTLRVATSHHIGLHRLPAALKLFSATYPQVRLDLRFMDSEQGCQAVVQGDVELAVVTLPAQPVAQLTFQSVWVDPLNIVVGRRHPLVNRRGVSAAELCTYPAVLPGVGTYTREIIIAALARAQGEVQAAMSTNYLEVLKMLTAIGLGWSALPDTLIDESVKVVHIKNIRIRRTLGIVQHQSRTLSNAGESLIALIVKLAARRDANFASRRGVKRDRK